MARNRVGRGPAAPERARRAPSGGCADDWNRGRRGGGPVRPHHASPPGRASDLPPGQRRRRRRLRNHPRHPGQGPPLQPGSPRGPHAGAVRAYLDELGLPRGDVHLDLTRLRRLAVEAIGAMSDEELAGLVEAPLELAPAMRGARDLREARGIATSIVEPPAPAGSDSPETLERFSQLRERADGQLDAAGAKAILRELKAVGGDLRALRLALTGAERGPELWTVLLALSRDEALRRVEAATR